MRRRVSACAGDSQTIWDGTILVGASFVVVSLAGAGLAGASFVVAILVVDDASTTESMSFLVESGLAGRFAGAGFMRKMTLPFS